MWVVKWLTPFLVNIKYIFFLPFPFIVNELWGIPDVPVSHNWQLKRWLIYSQTWPASLLYLAQSLLSLRLKLELRKKQAHWLPELSFSLFQTSLDDFKHQGTSSRHVTFTQSHAQTKYTPKIKVSALHTQAHVVPNTTKASMIGMVSFRKSEERGRHGFWQSFPLCQQVWQVLRQTSRCLLSNNLTLKVDFKVYSENWWDHC